MTGLDEFDYGALTLKEVASGVVVLPTAEVAFIEFDANPACFASFVRGVQRVEDFLANGARCTAECGPPFDEAALRQHLLDVRKPGVTTRVEVRTTLNAPADRWIVRHELVVGAPWPPVPMPGPTSAGLYSWPSPDRRAPRNRHLATTGRQAVKLLVSINGPSIHPATTNHIEHVEILFDLDVVAGNNVVEVRCDAHAWPAVKHARRCRVCAPYWASPHFMQDSYAPTKEQAALARRWPDEWELENEERQRVEIDLWVTSRILRCRGCGQRARTDDGLPSEPLTAL